MPNNAAFKMAWKSETFRNSGLGEVKVTKLESERRDKQSARTKVSVPNQQTLNGKPATVEDVEKFLLGETQKAIVERNRELEQQKAKHRVTAEYAFVNGVHQIVFNRANP